VSIVPIHTACQASTRVNCQITRQKIIGKGQPCFIPL
jgi:hypothetical protein